MNERHNSEFDWRTVCHFRHYHCIINFRSSIFGKSGPQISSIPPNLGHIMYIKDSLSIWRLQKVSGISRWQPFIIRCWQSLWTGNNIHYGMDMYLYMWEFVWWEPDDTILMRGKEVRDEAYGKTKQKTPCEPLYLPTACSNPDYQCPSSTTSLSNPISSQGSTPSAE